MEVEIARKAVGKLRIISAEALAVVQVDNAVAVEVSHLVIAHQGVRQVGHVVDIGLRLVHAGHIIAI